MAIIPRSRTIIAFCVIANAGLLLWAIGRYRPAQPEMQSLAQFVLETGQPTWVPAVSLSCFGLPYDDLKFYELRAESEGGTTKAIQVRYRKSGDIDIFLLDLPGNDGRGYFYLTSTHGRLTKAAYFGDRPEVVSDAAERFQSELGFWKRWQREKLKRLESRYGADAGTMMRR